MESLLDIVLIIAGTLFMLAGLGGAIVPVIPGPPLSYAGLLLLHFSQRGEYSLSFLVGFGVMAAVVTVLDNLLPVWGTRRFGGSKLGITGAAAGLIAGFFVLPPFGLVLLPFAGALLGEFIAGKGVFQAVKSSLGSLAGFLAGTFLKLAAAALMLYYFIIEAAAV